MYLPFLCFLLLLFRPQKDKSTAGDAVEEMPKRVEAKCNQRKSMRTAHTLEYNHLLFVVVLLFPLLEVMKWKWCNGHGKNKTDGCPFVVVSAVRFLPPTSYFFLTCYIIGDDLSWLLCCASAFGSFIILIATYLYSRHPFFSLFLFQIL